MVYHITNKRTIITVALLLYFLGLYAQKPSDAQGVYVQFSGISLGDALAQISEIHHVQFSYGNDHLELNKIIHFHSEGRSLEQTLAQLFEENNILYAYIGNQIALKQGNKRDQRRKDRQVKKKKRENQREERDKQTLERGTLFDFDIHSEIVGIKVIAEVEEEEERILLATKEIQPLVAKTIDGEANLKQEIPTDKWTAPVFRKYSTSFGQISVFPFLSTDKGNITRRHVFSFNIFYGINGGVNGLEFGVIGNSIRRNAHGIQFGGFFNTVGGHLYGTQIAGLLNITKGEVVGLQLSGLWNLGSNIYGTQVSILSNIARDLYGTQISCLTNAATDVYGLQISGLFNFANGKLSGMQIGGFGNVAWGGKSAVQFAGVFNTSAKAQFQVAGFFNNAQQVDGAQISAFNIAKNVNGFQVGLVNIATKELNGVQMGFINSAPNAKGVMIGFINVIDSVKGLPLGLINIVRRNGYNRFELSLAEAMFVNLGVKFGSKHFYHIIHGGWRVGGDNVYSWSIGVGAGTKIEINKKYHLNLELLTAHVNERYFFLRELNLFNQFKITFDIALSERLSIFFGPTFNAHVSRLYNPDTQKYGSNIMPYSLYDETTEGTNWKLWIGLTAGFRF